MTLRPDRQMPSTRAHHLSLDALRRWPAVAAVIGIIVLILPSVVDAAAGQSMNPQNPALFEEAVYIVQFAAPPALTYRGRPNDIAATRPAKGKKFDPRAPEVRRYTRRLLDKHDQALRDVGAYDNKVYSYRYTFNGFAARLTGIQAQKLRSRKDVLNVWQDSVRYLYTNDSPTFLGLFDATAGLAAARQLNGDGVVIGIIDSGIAPEHPSFADIREADRPGLCRSEWAETSLLGLWLCQRFKNRDDVKLFDPPAGWNGTCETGENFLATACNNKIIGARFYLDGFQSTFLMDANEFISPRDADGHGTHIASIAAGTEVRATIGGNEIDRIVGIAPRARIAVYKACWLEPGAERGSCSTSDLQRAIEDAVADGVDIINYSVGNTDISISDPDDLALLAASNAGVLSVVAAGNDGPAAGGVGSILSPAGAPWVLTVAASSRTGDRFEKAVRVDTPSDVAGDYVAQEASFTPPLIDNGPIAAALILVDDNDTTGGTTYDACTALTNGDELTDKIAFLQRGGPTTCTFEVKLRNVDAAGAAAAVVFSNNGELIVMGGTRDSVNIPAVMIGQSDGEKLLAKLQNGETVEVTLDKALILAVPDNGNVMASFSSRGPNMTALDILKPDVTAPGVNILAGQTPDVANGIRGEFFQYLSGTSQSTPHVAGIAALIRQDHPDWSPAAIKSALVTTGRQDVVETDGTNTTDPFDFGGGHVVPNLAVNPGLVYEADKEDYDAFLCGLSNSVIGDTECADLVAAGFPTEATNLNQPSIAVSALVSSKTITRRVTNVGAAAQYTVAVDAPPGIDVDVTPSVLSLGSGETDRFNITMTVTSAALNTWHFGSLTWSDNEHIARSPIAVRPEPFFAPLDIIASGASGTLQFNVQFGYTGDYSATIEGLAAPVLFQGTVTDDPFDTYIQIPLQGTVPTNIFRVPPGTINVSATDTWLRVALFDANTTGDDDLDLYVYYCPQVDLCDPPFFSGRFDSNELIELEPRDSGSYMIDVHGFNTESASTDFDLFVWTVGAADNEGNPFITGPSSATNNQQGQIGINWDGLGNDTHLGTVTHRDANKILELTVIEIRN